MPDAAEAPAAATATHSAPQNTVGAFGSAFDGPEPESADNLVSVKLTVIEDSSGDDGASVGVHFHIPALHVTPFSSPSRESEARRSDSDSGLCKFPSAFDDGPASRGVSVQVKRCSGTGTDVESAASGFAPVVSLQGVPQLNGMQTFPCNVECALLLD